MTEPAHDKTTSEALHWLMRSYDSAQEWKGKASDIYMSLNGDGNLARSRLAYVVRSYFVETPPTTEEVTRWTKGFEGQETVAWATEFIKHNPNLSDQDVLAELPEGGSLANVKQARKLISSGAPVVKPIAPDEPTPIKRYRAVYFPKP